MYMYLHVIWIHIVKMCFEKACILLFLLGETKSILQIPVNFDKFLIKTCFV